MKDIQPNQLRQDIQEFLETKGIKWNGLYIGPNGQFVPFSNNNHKFINNLLCAHMNDNNQMSTKFFKASKYDLCFYEYKENAQQYGFYKISKNYNRDWRSFCFYKYGSEYLEELEKYKNKKIEYLDKVFYNNLNPNTERVIEYMDIQSEITELESDLDFIYYKSSYETQFNIPYEEEIQNLEDLLDPETLAELYPEPKQEDEDPFKDDYYFEENDDDDDEYVK